MDILLNGLIIFIKLNCCISLNYYISMDTPTEPTEPPKDLIMSNLYRMYKFMQET